MNGQEHRIRERFAQVACQSCGAEHQPDDVLVLAQRGSRWLVLLTCRRCTRRRIYLASFPHPASRAERLRDLDGAQDIFEPAGDADDYLRTILRNWYRHTPDPASSSDNSAPRPTSPPSSTSPSASRSASVPHDVSPITTADVARMRHFLDGFNGDFHALFGADGSGSR